MKRIGLIVVMLSIVAGVRAEQEKIKIGAGNTVGIYYGTSSAVAKLFNYKRAEYDQWIVTEASDGSIENINNVLSKKVDFGLAQANILAKARKGMGPWEGTPETQLMEVLKLYIEDVTIVAAEDAGIKTMADLKGKRINIGAPGSSDQLYARNMLKMADINPEDVTILETHTSRSSDLLADKKIDAYFFTVGHPAFSVREASAGKRKIRLVPLDPFIIDFGVKFDSTLKASKIPIDYYPEIGNTAAVPTLGVPVILFTQQGMNEETVYRMVKEVMENLDLFRRQHPALRNLSAEGMEKETVLPMHPGAKRYFREIGLLP